MQLRFSPKTVATLTDTKQYMDSVQSRQAQVRSQFTQTMHLSVEVCLQLTAPLNSTSRRLFVFLHRPNL